MSDEAALEQRDFTKSFFFDIAKENFVHLADRITARCADPKEREWLIDLYGNMDISILVDIPTMLVTYCKVPPDASVKPHRHGRNQFVLVIKGELHYGSQVIRPEMGYFGPDKFYSWKAGPQGCEFIEIMDGPVGLYTPRGSEYERDNIQAPREQIA